MPARPARDSALHGNVADHARTALGEPLPRALRRAAVDISPWRSLTLRK